MNIREAWRIKDSFDRYVKSPVGVLMPGLCCEHDDIDGAQLAVRSAMAHRAGRPGARPLPLPEPAGNGPAKEPEFAQRSAEWHAARRGRLSASLVGAAVGISSHQTPLALYRQLVGETKPFTGNAFTRWGASLEDRARAAWEGLTGRPVDDAGFQLHATEHWLGCSPDGLVPGRDGEYEDGGVELKCPYNEGNCATAEVGPAGIEPAHVAQVLCCMAVTGRRWWDLAYYRPDTGPRGEMHDERITIWRYRDSPELAAAWAEILARCRTFFSCVVMRSPPPKGRPPMIALPAPILVTEATRPNGG